MEDRHNNATVYQLATPAQPWQQQPTNLDAVGIVDHLLYQALTHNVSDIHLQPCQERVAVRMRTDGLLHEHFSINTTVALAVVSRIKVLASMDIAVQRVAQDGKIKVMRTDAPDNIVYIRVSAFPAIHGQQLVLRILDRSHALKTLQSLGLSAAQQKSLSDVIARPHGMLLVTGPTGSGKSTTLYALLASINRIEKHIITIEEPVEYELNGITQSQVNKLAGFTFGNGLSAILRQDPDVILIGEIRDLDTVQIAIQSALTGHLVLSTLHTNDAPSSITRLRDMQVPAYLINASLSCVVAQRLARVLCDNCKKPVPISSDLAALCKQHEVACAQVYEPQGCSSCNHLGHKGRIGLFEILPITEDLMPLITKGASTQQLRQAAQAAGMRTMLQDGLTKVASGTISAGELSRTLIID